jgi:hypothetical protein
MEILAISGLAYIGTILNQHLVGDYQEPDKKNTKDEKKNTEAKENFAFFNKRDYQSSEGNATKKKYEKRVKEIRDLTFIPKKTNVIPSFYNQIPAVGEEYKEKKLKIPGRLDNTSGKELFSLDDQFKFGELTKEDPKANGFELEIQQNWTPFAEGGDMTYGIFKKDELKHNNMQPFFRRRDDAVDLIDGKMTDEINSTNNYTKMELFTGSSKNYYPKEAPPAFFEPMKDVHFVNGTPNQTAELIDRYIPGNQRQGEKPFQPVKVQPGLGLGYNEESKTGFHDPYRAPQITIDFQRVGNRIQKSNPGVVIPGQKGQKQPVDPVVAKRRPEKVFEAEDYMHGGGNGAFNKPAVNPEQVLKDQARKFSIELKNGLGMSSGSLVGPFNPDGAKRDPHRLHLEGFEPVGPSLQSVNNNNLPSYYLLDNQRTETAFNYYDAPASGAVQKTIQFNTQPTNSTMRQTTAETAQDGIAYGSVQKTNQFNTQATNSTMRQITAETAQDGMAYGSIQKSNQFNTQPTNSTLRQTTAEPAQDGMAYGGIQKTNQYNLQPTNSTLRQSTAEPAQDGMAYGDIRQVHQYNTQPTNSTIRQTTAETAQDGAAYGDVRQVHQFNTQPTNSTMRQTTADTAQDGAAYGDVRQVHQYNTQAANSTMRQTTAETAQENGAFGVIRKVNQFNTQAANSTMRQNTAETAQNNPARHTVPKIQQYNPQAANATLRQAVNYNGYNGGTHVLVEELRSRSDANAMETHSAREDTTKSRTFTNSGWNEGISKQTLGDQSSKERDINNNWTRVNPPSSGARSLGTQNMQGFNLDDRIIYQLNRIKEFPSMGDRIENSVTQVLQNNELINNVYQKYKE